MRSLQLFPTLLLLGSLSSCCLADDAYSAPLLPSHLISDLRGPQKDIKHFFQKTLSGLWQNFNKENNIHPPAPPHTSATGYGKTPQVAISKAAFVISKPKPKPLPHVTFHEVKKPKPTKYLVEMPNVAPQPEPRPFALIVEEEEEAPTPLSELYDYKQSEEFSDDTDISTIILPELFPVRVDKKSFITSIGEPDSSQDPMITTLEFAPSHLPIIPHHAHPHPILEPTPRKIRLPVAEPEQGYIPVRLSPKRKKPRRQRSRKDNKRTRKDRFSRKNHIDEPHTASMLNVRHGPSDSFHGKFDKFGSYEHDT